MGLNIRGRSFLTLLDFTPDEINYLLDLASEFKRMKNNGIEHKWLTDKQIVLLFEKTSTRTRCAFEVGARDLGMGVTFLDSGSSQMGKKESLADTAKVLGRMFDGIEYRGFKQSVVEDLARYSGVPVWNGLTDQFHPTQMLADIMTAREEFGDMRGRKLTFFGDARNNVANSLMVVCAKLGMHFCACGPEPMLNALYKASTTSGQMSYEERMGCGFGACMGCSCKTLTGNKRICKEGPVMKKEEILWD